MVIEGLNYLSEHGIEVDVMFEATDGTPFEGGTSDTIVVTGTVTSNTTIELMSPIAAFNANAIVTVTLPGGISGSSSDAIAELVGGFLGPPSAVNDSYPVVGNVQISIPAATGVLLNDSPGDCEGEEDEEEITPQKAGSASPYLNGLTVVSFDAVSAQGGEVNVLPDGSFVYNPPVGYQGPDSFDYEMTNGTQNDTATVNLNVQEMVWFINDLADTAVGDGRATDPFNSIFAFNAIQGGMAGPGDYIFVYYGSGNPYDGGVTMLEDQKLVGEGVELNVLGMTIVQAGNRPTLTQQGLSLGESQIAVPCVVLGDRALVTGLNIEDCVGVGILGDFASGPTRIDRVDITRAGEDGIRLSNCNGDYEVGDPADPTGDVNIDDCSFNGMWVQVDGTLTVTGGTIQNNDGAGVRSEDSTDVQLHDATILGRNGELLMTFDIGDPGRTAIYGENSTITLENTIVTGGKGGPGVDGEGVNDGGNGGVGGAAIQLRGDANTLMVTLASNVTGGEAGDAGDALGTGTPGELNQAGRGIDSNSGGSVIEISDSTVAGGATGDAGLNTAGMSVFSVNSVGGEGVSLDDEATLSVTDSTVSGGDSRLDGLASGSGIFVFNGLEQDNLDPTRIYDITIDNSTVQAGGGVDGTTLRDGSGGGCGIQVFESQSTLRILNGSMVLGGDAGLDFDEDGFGANGGGAGCGLFWLAEGQILVTDSTVQGGEGGGIGPGLAGNCGGGGEALFLVNGLFNDPGAVLVVTLTNATIQGGDAGDGGATPTNPGDFFDDGGAGVLSTYDGLTLNTVGPTTISGGRGSDGNGLQRGTRGGIGIEEDDGGIYNINSGAVVQAGQAGNSAGSFDGGAGAQGILVFNTGSTANLASSATVIGGNGGNATGTGSGGAGGAATDVVDPNAALPNGTVNDSGATLTNGTAGTP